MRLIGQVDNELDANVFRDYLFNRDIVCDIEPASGGGWSVWVHDEDHLAEVSRLFAAFKLNPGSPEFIQGADGAEKKRAARDREEREAARRDRKRAAIAGLRAGHGILTLGLLIASVIVTLATNFGSNLLISRWLFTTSDVAGGQVWRLFTPVLIHFTIIHLLFNMMWLRDLGNMTEQIRGTRFLLVFILITAAFSNAAQYVMSGPLFGGMSGVVYGLLGYVWMQSRLNPWSGFVMHSFTFNFMLVWFFLCLSGFIGNIANTTHAVGLVMGLGWGFIDARRGRAA